MRRRWSWFGLALIAGVAGIGCHSTSGITLSVTPATATVLINNTAQFVPTETGSTNAVVWSVNGIASGNTTVGTINSNGLFTAPASVPNPSKVTVTGTVGGTDISSSGTVTIVSGVQVSVAPAAFTVGTGESFPFVATVSGVPANAVTSTCNSTTTTSGLPSCTAVTWTVSTNGGTVGATTGIYTAPSSLSSTGLVNATVTATSVFDTTQTATAVVSLVTATDPTLASIGPNAGARGAAFQDVYLSGTNFISTTNVFVNGVQVPSADILVSSVTCATLTTTNSSGTSVPIPPCTTASLTSGSTVMRVRLPDIFLATALTLPSTNSVALTFTVARQNGAKQLCSPNPTQCQLILSPQRPVVVGTSPDSITQSVGTAFSFNVDGGFFGTPLNPVVTGQFGGQPIFPTISSVNPDRQLSVPVPASQISLPGLYEVGVVSDTSGIPPATSNLAIQPQYSSSPTALTTLPVGTTPAAVAINSATGIAAIVNTASNDLYLIDLTQPTPTVVAKICTVGVTGSAGTAEPTCGAAAPTGVAIDNIRNIALVTNSGTNTVAVVNLQTQMVTQILSLGTVLNSTTIPQVPSSVGINPVTGRAIVAFKGTNFGVLLDTTTLNTGQCPVAAEPQCVAGVVNISTGATPRIAVSPKLNWALVTPGGLGSLAVVNLSQQSTNTIVSATRSNGTVTVITTLTHTLQVGSPFLVTGSSDPTLNGVNTVVSVPSSTSFTFTQPSTLANSPTAGSPGGVVSYGIPVTTVATSLTTTGVAINDQTFKAFLADPGINGTPATIFSVLDQSSVNVGSTLSVTLPSNGTIGAAFNPLTNIAVAVNEINNTGYVIDPRSPTILTTFPVGHDPQDIAIDAGTDLAVVVNQGDNSATIVPLGSVRTPQVLQISPAQLYINSTLTSSVSPTAQTMTIIGKGFTGTSVARLDGTPLATVSVTDRMMTVTVPAAMLAAPHQYSLDVSNGGVLSNASSFKVIQAVSVTGFGCAATPAPTGVAIDAPNNIAVVSDPNCNEVYLVNLTTGMGQVVSVGTSPLGVAVTAQGGFAVVANTGSNNVSFIDDINADVTQTITTDADPSGVAIDPVLGQIAVTASGAGSVDIFSANSTSATQAVATAVQQGPVPVAIDPVDHIAAIGNQTSNSVSLVTLVGGGSAAAQTPSVSLPTGIIYEPISDQFIVASSVTDEIEILNPVTGAVSPVSVGINPTSLAYNYATSTLVTTNTIGQNMTVLDFVTGTVREVFPLSSSGQFSVDIHPQTNIAVVADATNSRVLLVPVP